MNKEILKLLKEVQRSDRKWTRIYLTFIFIYVTLGIIFIAIGLYSGLLGMIWGIIFTVMALEEHKSKIKKHMKRIEKMKTLDKRIEELEKGNQELREEIWITKEKELLEFVEIHAIAQNYEMVDRSKKKFSTSVKVLYPNNIDNGKYYFDDFITPNSPKETEESLAKSFKNITEQIIKQIDSPIELINKGIVYKVCPEMLCGDNPCSCE